MDSLNEVIHKESNKEKQKSKELKAIGLKENSTSLIQRQLSNEQQTKDKSISKHRLKKQRLNSEIDQYLNSLLIEGMITQQYWNFHAKACHVLGVALCNQLAINARTGLNSQRLYAFKIKGAMQLHHKQLFESMDDSAPSLNS